MANLVTVALSVAPKIEEIFGSKNISDVLGGVDWSKLSVKEAKEKSFVHCDLAPSFGNLNRESLVAMDNELKIMIAGTTRAIKDLPDNQRSWENVTAALSQNPLLEPLGDEIARSDKLIKDYGASAFKFDGAADQSIVKEVQTWFTSLVSDDDVIQSTNIDINILAEIVAWSGATVTDVASVFGKSEEHTLKLIDVGILRYPDVDHPYFKLYRIQLEAWSDCTRVLFVQNDKNGITGQYNVRRYGPRASVIGGLKEATKKKAIQEAEDLFS